MHNNLKIYYNNKYIMDKYLEKFITKLYELLHNLHRYVPTENLKKILAVYKKLDMGLVSMRYYSIMSEYGDAIKNNDENIFTHPITILPGIDISALWPKLKRGQKNKVWIHLNMLYVLSNMIIGEKEKQNLKGELLRIQGIDLGSNFLEVLKEQTRIGENEANLLVTYDRAERFAVQYEVKQVLREVGEGNPRFLPSRVRGIFRIHIQMDPKHATKNLGTLCRRDPSKFWYTYHWIPVEKWCPSTIKEMSVIVKQFAERIMLEERWRIRVNKRFYNEYHTQELIELLAEHVDRPNVDLENPDKTIRIEIMGDEAALSLLGPREHFSVNDVKNEVLTAKK